MDRQQKTVALIGVPLEEGSGRGGCAMGPAAYRIAGIAQAMRELDYDVEDRGDLRPAPATDLPDMERARHLPVVGAFTRAIEAETYSAASNGAVPILLGGDHSLSMGSVSGMARYAREIGRPLYVLWLDAHSDFNAPATSPSGNIHGMPVAFFCGKADSPRSFPPTDPSLIPGTSIRSASAPWTRKSVA